MKIENIDKKPETCQVGELQPGKCFILAYESGTYMVLDHQENGMSSVVRLDKHWVEEIYQTLCVIEVEMELRQIEKKPKEVPLHTLSTGHTFKYNDVLYLLCSIATFAGQSAKHVVNLRDNMVGGILHPDTMVLPVEAEVVVES